MKTKFLILFFFAFAALKAQIHFYYYQNFDSAQVTGWSYYHLSGSADLQVGIPQTTFCNAAYSTPNVLATNLAGTNPLSALMYAQTPAFDLSDTTINYVVGFRYKSNLAATNGCNLQYSLDTGVTWTVLCGTPSDYMNWGTTNLSGIGKSFAGNQNLWTKALHKLTAVRGQSSVIFRFQFTSMNSASQYAGFYIDDFSIVPDFYDYGAAVGTTCNASANFTSFIFKGSISLVESFSPLVAITNKFYFSYDNIFDAGDSLIDAHSLTLFTSLPNYSRTLNMIPNLAPGDYYIFYHVNSTNSVQELNLSNNVSYMILHIEPTLVVPWSENFDDSTRQWQIFSGSSYNLPNNLIRVGNARETRAYGTHSGDSALYSIRNYAATSTPHTFITPFLDLRTSPNSILCFWLKRQYGLSNLNLNIVNSNAVSSNYSFGMLAPLDDHHTDSRWDCECFSLSSLNNAPSAKIGISLPTDNYSFFVIDDIYVGVSRPDLSVDNNDVKFTASNDVSDLFSLKLYSGRLGTTSGTEIVFYFSTDSIYDAGDTWLTTLVPPAVPDTGFSILSFTYTKQSTSLPYYFILYAIDTANTLDEMREYNNEGYFKVYQSQVQSLPYTNDFEQPATDWRHDALYGTDMWMQGTPPSTSVIRPYSGTQGFTLDTNRKDTLSLCRLYTPIFDLTQLTHPVLSFNLDMSSVYPYGMTYTACYMNMEYSVDGGANWQVLDTMSNSFHLWYFTIPMNPNAWTNQPCQGMTSTDYLENYHDHVFPDRVYNTDIRSNRNTLLVLDLGPLGGNSRIQFRYNLVSARGFQFDGPMIDDFSIEEAYSDLSIGYSRNLMIDPTTASFPVNTTLYNKGNFLAPASRINYYLSHDTIFDLSDAYVGGVDVGHFSPASYFTYFSIMRLQSGIAGNYDYLIYVPDANNTVVESDETNNIGYWNLNTHQVFNSFPYQSDFLPVNVDGWTWYNDSIPGHYNDRNFKNNSMLSNYLNNYQTSGFYTNSENSSSISLFPIKFLQSPAFDFSTTDVVNLSFDKIAIGAQYTDGGNLQFSYDGGLNWNILTASMGNATNWYNINAMSNLGNEPGWGNYTQTYVPATFSTSLLGGYSNVVFRIKYKSNFYPNPGGFNGFAFDNFQIATTQADYTANDHFSTNVLNATLTNNSITIPYSITNTGPTNGRSCKLKYYWSTDTIFNSTDPLISTVYQVPIGIGATYTGNTTINYVLPVTQFNYYIFCKVDANDTIHETNEVNNLNSYHLIFDQLSGIENNIQAISSAYVYDGIAYLTINQDLLPEQVEVNVYNNHGELITVDHLKSNQTNKIQYPVPAGLAAGVYIIQFKLPGGFAYCRYVSIE
ncbi:hypothetical protein BH09BAC5_BH09BAC5_05340 [soil metagenome]